MNCINRRSAAYRILITVELAFLKIYYIHPNKKEKEKKYRLFLTLPNTYICFFYIDLRKIDSPAPIIKNY